MVDAYVVRIRRERFPVFFNQRAQFGYLVQVFPLRKAKPSEVVVIVNCPLLGNRLPRLGKRSRQVALVPRISR